MKACLAFSFAVILSFLLSLSASAQSAQTRPTPEPNTQDEVVRVDTNLVGVPVTVLDKNGRRITDLKQEEFHIYEDGVEQQVALFAPGQTPVTVLLLFDKYVIGKRPVQINDYRELAGRFIKDLRPGDRVIVAKTGNTVSDIFELSADGQLVKQKLKPNWHLSSSIHDAVSRAIRGMNALPGRKAIVFFSDGVLRYLQEVTINMSSGSLISQRKIEPLESSSEKSTAREAEESDAPIYAMRYNTLTDAVRNNLYPKGHEWQLQFYARIRAEHLAGAEYLGALAYKSGARMYRAQDPRGIDQLFAETAAEISQQYNLAYYPKKTGATNERHEIKVRVDRSDVVVRTRSNYVFHPPQN